MLETASSGRTILKVHELGSAIRQLLERQFSDLWVEGEISDIRRPRSGHLYFTLKDSRAAIKSIIFKSHLRFLRFLPKEGVQVLIRAHLSVYEPRGEYQLICDYIEPKGAGALQAAFEALKEKLRLEGLFSPERKQPLPILPLRVGIITSPSGAAIQDMIRVIQNSAFKCELLICPVAVQGAGAASQIADALDEMNRYRRNTAQAIDLLILTRGGGSLEDLWAFNEESVVRAIARSIIPVISAIGHESDSCISDYAADLRAATPSIAAEIVVQQGLAAIENHHQLGERLISNIQAQILENKNRLAMALRLLIPPTRQCQFLQNQVAQLFIRLKQAMDRQIDTQRNRLMKETQGLGHLSPISRLRDLKQQHDTVHNNLMSAGRHLIERQKIRLQKGMAELHLLSPLNILGRGYSITRKRPGLEVIHNATEISINAKIKVTLHHGALNCTVDEKET